MNSYLKKHFSKERFFVVFFFISFTSLATFGGKLTNQQIVEKLSVLKPLPKVHYTFATPGGNLLDDKSGRLLYEYARIANALTVWVEWANYKQIEACIYTCARINKTKPKIKSTIGLGCNPWDRKFGKNLPPTDKGATYKQELEFFTQRFESIKDWVDAANKKYGSNVQISAILLDTERFHASEKDTKYNAAIKEKLDTFHLLVKKHFPESKIEWYGRGIRNNSYDTSPYWTGQELTESLSCSLYTIPEIDRMRKTYRRTCKLADQKGVNNVTPWVALSAGYRRGVDKEYWDINWQYDLIYAYMIGAELNNSWYSKYPEKYGPYDRAEIVIFYPPAFCDKTPEWGRYFIAYVRGAHNIKNIDDL